MAAATRPNADRRMGAQVAATVAGRIVGLGRRHSRHQYELCVLLADYDLSGHWALTGAVTCSRWAADACEVETGTAGEWLRVGHALRHLPGIAAAFEAGELSYSKVRTLTRIAIDHPGRQDELIALARECTASALSHELARWSATEEDDDERDRRHRREMGLTVRTEPDGAGVITIRLPPLAAAAAMAAIDHRTRTRRSRRTPKTATGSGTDPTTDASVPPRVTARPTLAQQRAFAFVDLLTHSDGATVVTELLIHIRDDGASLSNGTPIAGHLVERLAPNAFFRLLLHDAQGRPINASSRRRHPSVRQQRVIDERDGYTCTTPGCSTTEFLDYDHDPPFEETLHTVIDETSLRCDKHHKDRHRGSDPPRRGGSL